jgi:glucose-6-phosphate dehydrogenase assembly protein OpcA
MDPTLESLIPGELRACDAAQIEAELSALWGSASVHTESRRVTTRACALTLLVYVESESAGREVSSLFNQVSVQNPCRSIVMVVDREGVPPGLTAAVSGHCHLPTASQKQVCSEEILVVTRGGAVSGLASVVVPLVVSGLPVYLWWRAGRFAPPPQFERILRLADRVLVDSARFSDPVADSRNLATVVGDTSGRIGFSDMSWLRLTPWRELVAQCFDSAETRPCLERVRRVRIEYRDDKGAHSAEALLLVGWLAGRLKWKCQPRQTAASASTQDQEGIGFWFESGSGNVEVRCLARAKMEKEASGLVSLILACGEPAVTFSFAYKSSNNSIETRTELPSQQPIERRVRVRVPDEVGLLNEDLKFGRRDRVYEEALGMVVRMTEEVRGRPRPAPRR